jgi:hypothetical protein
MALVSRKMQGLPPRKRKISTRCNHYIPATEKRAEADWYAIRAELGLSRVAYRGGSTINLPCGAAEAVRGTQTCYKHLPEAICAMKKKLKWHKQHACNLTVLVTAMSKVLYNNVVKRSCE